MQTWIRAIVVAWMMAITTALAAAGQVFVTGNFNGWNVDMPVQMAKNAQGYYETIITFDSNINFKMSTVKGTWDVFDTRTLVITEAVVNDTWLGLEYSPTSLNQKAPEAGTYRIMVDMEAMAIKFIPITAPDTPWSGTLPLMVITTENYQSITSKDTYLNATYYIDNMGIEGIESIGSADAPMTMEIRGRGNYSWWGFDKKPYRIKLSEKQPLLGMKKSKHWALLAHADDNQGFMRNFGGFTASQLLEMPWTPDMQPCEVVLNGDYVGLYFLTETIRVDKNRVNIVEQADYATADIDGGWLIEIDNYDSDPHVTVYENNSHNSPIWFTYKSPEALSDEQSLYLQSQMQLIDNAVYAGNLTSLQALVDFEVLAKYYICQEVMDDGESFHGSCYLNRDRGKDCKWMFGPVWDFGNSLLRGDSRKFIWQDPPFHQVWIGRIYKYTAFQDIVKNLWINFLRNDDADKLTSDMATFANKIAVAAICDANRWPKYGNRNETSRAAAAYGLVNKKIDWLKTQWGVPAGIEDICINQPQINVTSNGNQLIISAQRDTYVPICTPSGICRSVKIRGGATQIVTGLPSGIYFVGNQKIILR